MLQFEIKWTVSKAQATYGYNVCTVQGRNRKGNFVKASCNGGGYNMLDTAIGELIEEVYKLN